jgi:hypothetical protein
MHSARECNNRYAPAMSFTHVFSRIALVGWLVVLLVPACSGADKPGVGSGGSPATAVSAESTEPTAPPNGQASSTDGSAPLAANGAACTRGSDCDSGICEGEGCGADAGVCQDRSRMCTTDLVAYCGCDGVTFRGSSGCPGRLYAARRECKSGN